MSYATVDKVEKGKDSNFNTNVVDIDGVLHPFKGGDGMRFLGAFETADEARRLCELKPGSFVVELQKFSKVPLPQDNDNTH